MSGEAFVVRYRFDLEDGTRADFDVELDPVTLQLGDPPSPLPGWTALDFHQCPHCPLEVDRHPHCPAAAHLARLVTFFDRLPSHAPARVEVRTDERTVTQQTTVQRGVSALMGLLIAASGCPLTTFFRPMARFHLPFATSEETTYRAAATYLLAQYFRRRAGGPGELELEGLTALYQDIHRLNGALAKRLRAATQADASVNAVVLLDVLAGALTAEAEDRLPELEACFRPYLMGAPRRSPLP